MSEFYEQLSLINWALLVIAAIGIGVTKSGFSGVSLLHVLVFAHVFGAKASTGVVLPMLIVGDVLAMLMFGKHADWVYVRRMMPPAILGVLIGWMLMHRLSESLYRPITGGIILMLASMQLARLRNENWLASIPHSNLFSWGMGIAVGVTTMLANAAGPVFGLFLISIGLPKKEFVGTAAWFFLILNVLKIPFSWNLGLIGEQSLMVNALLAPLILLGLFAGRAIAKRISQKSFEMVILVLSILAAMQLLLV
jgi:uncharacterized membrane protein YfcA